jgi:tetratricopeptide (TPR) repeat protein
MKANTQTDPGSADTPLSPYEDTPVHLFIANHRLRVQLDAVAPSLPFSQVEKTTVSPGFFPAMRQLFGLLLKWRGLVLVNHPPQRKKDAGGRQYEDYDFHNFYKSLGDMIAKTRKDPQELVGRCIPILEAPQDHDVRRGMIEDLFSFGITGMFFLELQDLRQPKDEQLRQRLEELEDYFLDYFLSREQKLTDLKQYRTAEELKAAREEADTLMAEVAKLKEAKEYEKAVALCRKATTVLPSDPDPYLEGGRLLVKKKRYPPAMTMFRDAEKVSQALPTPDQEIGKLRTAQAVDYVNSAKERGEGVDPAILNQFLTGAMESFQSSLKKAAKIKRVRESDRETGRKEAVAEIAGEMLSMDLGEVLGEDNPIWRQIGKIAQEAIKEQIPADAPIPKDLLIQFGLSALYDGEFDKAQKYFLQAAKDPELHETACLKINNMGTHLRRSGRLEHAIATYERLLKLNPPFRGVVLFNLAIAQRSKSDDLLVSDQERAAAFASLAAGTLNQAFYVDPNLPSHENFYENAVIFSTILKLVELFAKASALSQPAKAAGSPVCLQARERLDGMLEQGRQRDALGLLFKLAQVNREFFINFDQYASRSIMAFAQRLEPQLRKHASPKMRTFGKILAVLLQRGEKAQQSQEEKTSHPSLEPVMVALMQADQAAAAGSLGRALWEHPSLTQQGALAQDSTLVNLCREIKQKFSNLDLARIKAHIA